jgi:hypothetical protein
VDVLDEIGDFLERLARVANTVQKRIAWFLLLGLFASFAFAWQFYSADSSAWWNILKCGLVLLPVAIWGVVWALLSQLRKAPELASSLSRNQNLAMKNLRVQMAKPKLGVIALLSTIKELRDNDAFETVTDTIGSFTLLVNPLFLIIAFAMLVILLILILLAPFLLFF